MKKRSILPILFYILLLVVAFMLISNWLSSSEQSVAYSEVKLLFEKEQVRSFTLSEEKIVLQLYDSYNGEKSVSATVAGKDAFLREMGELIATQSASGVLQKYSFTQTEKSSYYDLILPLLIVGLVLLLLWGFLAGRANAANDMSRFGKARTQLGVPAGKKVTFDDVAGADEEKAELAEIVDFLRDPKKYTQIGARIPHGLLLVGPPGTGKTLLARAVAGEADVQFLSLSGSDFMEMYVGVGASRVRDLFAQAKRIAPAIIFIDEIDAVGRKRGTGLGGGHDEREQTLNQLLVEMDGFGSTEGVIVLAATNRADILDPALLRPGRFDRQIYVGRPDVKGRLDILKVHAKDKRLDEQVDLKAVARATSGFTGADLSNLLNEAAIMAARDDRQALSMADINEAVMKITAGPAKRSHLPQRQDLKATAIHEAGHAVAMYRLPTSGGVQHITIIPRGRSLGSTWTTPRDDTANMTRNEMYEQIVGLLGGRVAEALFVGDISVGASNDIDRASKLARDMVARYGMCEKLGTVSYLNDEELFIGRDYQHTKSYSEKVAATIDDEVKTLMDKAYEHCRQLLSDNSEPLQRVVDFLLENESMTGAQFAACMENRPIPAASSTALTDEKA